MVCSLSYLRLFCAFMYISRDSHGQENCCRIQAAERNADVLVAASAVSQERGSKKAACL